MVKTIANAFKGMNKESKHSHHKKDKKVQEKPKNVEQSEKV